MNKLSISLFGPVQVFADQEEITEFRMLKVRGLLVYLAADPAHTHRRETLMEMLWPGMPETSARGNLRQVLFHLRQAIPDFAADPDGEGTSPLPVLIANRQWIQFNPQADIQVDVVEFKALLRETQAHDHVDLFTCHTCRDNLKSAVDLYRGDFLEDFYLDDSNEFEEWSEISRQSYRRQVLDALETLTAIAIRQNVPAEARQFAERQLEIDNLRESAYRQLMEILALNGQRAESLSLYETCRRILMEELGMAPTARTTELYEKIRAGDLSFEQPPDHGVRGYDIKEEIGSGVYGAIHRGVQSAIGREVAIKIIIPRYANDPAFIRRFEAEAQTIARLEHPHIVPLYDYWREPGGAYLVMRLLRGGNLLSALEAGPWDPSRIQIFLDQIAPALDVAHRQGIVHRDIKPANFLFDESRNVYLSDFGIAKDLSVQDQLTLDGTLLGTPDYTSPEQLQEGPVSPQSDIYSLGAVVYEMLTGEKPYPERSVVRVIQNHLSAPFPLAQHSIPDLPLQIDDVIQRATAKDPGHRYGSALELAEDFRRAAQGGPVARPAISRPPDIDPAEAPNPYKGLRPFAEADAADFFGREALVGRLVDRLAESRFLAVVGPSGSGKSSAVRAGLIPALRGGALPGSESWFVAEMVPGTHPLEELELALWPVAIDPPPNLVDPMERDARGMLRTIRRILPDEENARLLLVIDQFEELFTLVDDESRRIHFLNSLYEAVAAPRSPLTVVVTLRADFYDRPLQYQAVAGLFRDSAELILPLDQDELVWAIQEPARQVGVRFEESVVSAMVAAATDQPGALPLMQYALTELFDSRQEGTITRRSFERVGGLLGALARRPNEIYSALTPGQQAAARQIFLRLVTLGEGVEDTRRRVRVSEFNELGLAAGGADRDIGHILQEFGNARLLTFDHDPLTREPTVEVAHEALLREWDLLRDWLDESRADVRLQRALAAAAAEWIAAENDDGYLLRGSRLSQFATWQEETDISLTQTEAAFLAASLEARHQRDVEEQSRRQRELETAHKLAESESRRAEEQARTAQRLRRRAWVLGGVLVLAAVLAALALLAGGLASRNEALADRSADVSRSLALAAAAQAALADSNTDQAVALALAASQIDAPPALAQQMLYEAAFAPGTVRRIEGGGDWRWALAVHPDGRTVASGADDSSVTLWEADTGEELIRLEGEHTESIGDVDFTPDGRALLSGAYDDLLILWDIETGEVIWRAVNPSGDVNTIDIAPDGQLAAAGTQGGVVTLWDMRTGELVGELAGHDPDFQLLPVAFSPDSRLVASGSEDGSLIIWDVAGREPIHQLQAHDHILFALAFSPDSRTLASGGADNRIILWDVAAGEQVAELTGHKDWVFDVAINSDGSQLLSASRDQSMILWDMLTAEPLAVYQGDAGRTLGAQFLHDRQAVSSASTGNLRVWELADARLAETVRLAEGFMPALARSPESELVAIASEAEIEVKALNTGETAVRLQIPGDAVAPDPGNVLNSGIPPTISALAINASEDRLLAAVSTNVDGAVILWDLESGDELRRFDDHTAWIHDLVFSPDGEQFLSVSDDKTFIQWDVESGEVLRRFISPTDAISSAAFSPDGEIMAGGYGTYRYPAGGGDLDNNIYLWDADSGEEIRQLIGHQGAVTALQFSPDGETILSGSIDETVRLWDVATGKLIRRFDGHAGGVFSVTFSESGEYAASGAQDGTAIVWHLETGNQLRQFPGHAGLVHHVEFQEGDQRLLSAGEDGQLLLWNLSLDLEELQAWTHNNRFVPAFTCNQRAQYQIEPRCGAEQVD